MEKSKFQPSEPMVQVKMTDPYKKCDSFTGKYAIPAMKCQYPMVTAAQAANMVASGEASFVSAGAGAGAGGGLGSKVFSVLKALSPFNAGPGSANS